MLKPGTEETFRNALTEDARLTVDVISEQDFFAEQAKVADRLRALVLIVGLIVGIGAAFGGMNTMYAAVARRTREVGVLRTLGFGRGSVLTSFLVESVILAIAGGVVGDLLAIILGLAAGLNQRSDERRRRGVFVGVLDERAGWRDRRGAADWSCRRADAGLARFTSSDRRVVARGVTRCNLFDSSFATSSDSRAARS